jgi:hypothetical protein
MLLVPYAVEEAETGAKSLFHHSGRGSGPSVLAKLFKKKLYSASFTLPAVGIDE